MHTLRHVSPLSLAERMWRTSYDALQAARRTERLAPYGTPYLAAYATRLTREEHERAAWAVLQAAAPPFIRMPPACPLSLAERQASPL